MRVGFWNYFIYQSPPECYYSLTFETMGGAMIAIGLRSKAPRFVAFDITGCEGRERRIAQALRTGGIQAEVCDNEPGVPAYVTVRIGSDTLHEHGQLLNKPTASGGLFYNLSEVEDLIRERVEAALNQAESADQPV
jgi:hypothetical protein